MKGSLLPLFSGKSTWIKGTAINLHWILCELQTFKRNKNKHILQASWCGIHSPDLLVFSVIRNTLTQLAEFGLYTKRAEMLLTRNYTGLWFLLHVMRGEKEKHLILARDCANRQGPLPTYLATTKAIYQGTEAGHSYPWDLGVVLCKQAKTVRNLLLAYTRKSRGS